MFNPHDQGQIEMLKTLLNLTDKEIKDTKLGEDGTTKIERAVKGFQRINDLEPTGKINPETANAMEKSFDNILKKAEEIKSEDEQKNAEKKALDSTSGGSAKCEGIEFTHEKFMNKVKGRALSDSSGGCTSFNRRSCTSLAGMQSKVAKLINYLSEKCDTTITITGGTECGHAGGGSCLGRKIGQKFSSQYHAPGNAVFDLTYRNSKLNKCINKLGRNVNGAIFEIHHGPTHWHVNASNYKCS